MLGRRLAAETGQPAQVINLSRSGARIRDVLDTQLPALAGLKQEPDLVTVAIGGNDVRAYDPARFAADSAALTRALPAGAYVADVPYFMHGRWESNADEAARASPTTPATTGCGSSRCTTPCATKAGRRCSRSSPPTGSTPTNAATGSGPVPSGKR